MPDTSEPATIITRLIATGVPARALLARIATAFPDLSPAELSQALQVAQAQAERKALRPHLQHSNDRGQRFQSIADRHSN